MKPHQEPMSFKERKYCASLPIAIPSPNTRKANMLWPKKDRNERKKGPQTTRKKEPQTTRKKEPPTTRKKGPQTTRKKGQYKKKIENGKIGQICAIDLM